MLRALPRFPAAWRVLLLTFLLTGAVRSGRAQELTLPGVPVAAPVVPVEGMGYFLLYRSEAGDDGRDLYALRLLDDALKVRYEYTLALPVGNDQPQVLPGRATFALVFRVAQGLIIHTFNPTTGAHQQSEIGAAPDRHRQPANGPTVVGTPTDGFCLVQAYAAKDTTGFRISVLDAALQPKWTRLYIPTTLRAHYVQQVVVSKDMIGVVLADSYRVNLKTKDEHTVVDRYVTAFAASSGQELFRKPLHITGTPVRTARHLLALTDGRVAVAGEAYASKTARADSSLGLFLTTYRPDGTATTALTTWADVGTGLRNPALAAEVKENRGRFGSYELFSPDGIALRLVGEYAGGEAASQFVVVSYNAAGQPTASYGIARSLRAPDPGSRYLGLAGRQSKEPVLLYSGREPVAEFVYATPLADGPSRTAVRGEVLLEKLADVTAAKREMPELGAIQTLKALRDRLNAIDENLHRAEQGELPTFTPYDGALSFATAGPRQTVVYRFEPTHKQLRAYVQTLR